MLFFDFETRRSSKKKNLRTVGAAVYARDEETDVSIFSYKFIFSPEVSVLVMPKEYELAGKEIEGAEYFHEVTSECPEEIRDYVEGGGIVVAHNIEFDWNIWNHIMVPRYGWPYLKPEQCADTMAIGLASALPPSLGELGKAVGVEVEKDEEGRKVMLKMSKPSPSGKNVSSPELLGKLINYGARDILPMQEIYEKLPPLSEDEKKVWLINFLCNERGVSVDLDLIEKVFEIDDIGDEELKERAKEFGLTPEVIRSTAQFKIWLLKQGAKLETLNKDAVARYISKNKETLITRALELRSDICKNSLKKFKAMKERVCDDGRVRGNHVYHKATTGRFAGSGIQVQNMTRPLLKKDQIDEVISAIKAS